MKRPRKEDRQLGDQLVEVAYRAVDAINRRDFGTLLALMDDDVEVVSRIVSIEGPARARQRCRQRRAL